MPKAQSEENATSEADGLLVVDKTYSLMPDKGDDSFSFEVFILKYEAINRRFERRRRF